MMLIHILSYLRNSSNWSGKHFSTTVGSVEQVIKVYMLLTLWTFFFNGFDRNPLAEAAVSSVGVSVVDSLGVSSVDYGLNIWVSKPK